MRAITVRQPYAWAIVHGGKDVENRSQNIAGNYRGPVAIHAAKGYGTLQEYAHATRVVSALAGGFPHEEPTGVVIGVADLIDVHHAEECWDRELRRLAELYHSGQAGREEVQAIPDAGGGGMIGKVRFCSRWADAGVYHLVLANPRALPEPIPYKGRLGLWRIPDKVLDGAR